MPWKILDLPSDDEIAQFSKRFRKKAQFLVDESLGQEVALFLRAQGWNVKWVGEVGLIGHDDGDVLAYAQRTDRILLTHDADFLNDRLFPPHRNPGVVVLPGGSGEQEPLLRALGIMLTVVAPLREIYRASKVAISADGTIAITNRSHDTGAVETTRYRSIGKGPLEIWENG